jgi:DNA-binding GntR family transcriptional regulator
MDLPKIQTSNLFEQVYGTLKQLILRRKFRSNEKISIPTLAKELGVSITPIREALNRLESEGLVKTISKVGTFVVGIDRSYVEQVIECRLMIDLWVLERYRQFTEARFAEVTARLDALTSFFLAEAQLPSVTLEQCGQYDNQFHAEYLKASGNIKLVETYQGLMAFRSLTIGDNPTPAQYIESHSQHRAIALHLLERDWQQAREAIERHLNYSKHNLLSWVDSKGGEA